MVHWDVIGDFVSQYLRESKASDEAKRRGLIPMKRRGLYADPHDPSTAVAKSQKGGTVLAKLPQKKKIGKAPTKKRPTKPKTKKATIKKPSRLTDFTQTSEATEGLISGATTINKGGQSVDVRIAINPKTGKPIDVSKEAGRKEAIAVIDTRHKALHQKVLTAVDIALSASKGDPQGILAKKWLGELGEMLALRDLLEQGVEGYFLPAAAEKNDLVIFSPAGENDRNLRMQYVSVKSTKGGEEANALGANIAADFRKILGDKTMRIAGDDVSAFDYANTAMKVKRQALRYFTEGRAGRRGISTKGLDANQLQVKPERIDHPHSKFGFVNHADFLRARVIAAKEISHFLKGMKEELQQTEPIGTALAKSLQELVVSKRGAKAPNKLSVKDLDDWLVRELGKTLDETKSAAVAVADTMTARYAEGEGFVDTRIAVGEDVTKKRYETAIKRGLKLGEDGKPVSGAQQVELLMGFQQRTRALGHKDEGTAYLDGILNGKPTAAVLDIELSVSDYVDRIGFRRREVRV